MTMASRVMSTVDFWRLRRNLSMAQETIASMMEMDEVSAAKATVRKNTTPTIFPTVPMAAKTLGSAWNMRLGPDAMPSRPIKV